MMWSSNKAAEVIPKVISDAAKNKDAPSWSSSSLYPHQLCGFIQSAAGPACQHPWEEHALKTAQAHKENVLFVLLCSPQGKVTDKKEAGDDRGKVKRAKKKSFWKATQQSSFGHLTTSQLNR